jgi:hypothetical protein
MADPAKALKARQEARARPTPSLDEVELLDEWAQVMTTS